MIVVFKNLEKKVYEECNYMDIKGDFITLEKRFRTSYGQDAKRILVYLNKEEILCLEPINEVKVLL